MVKENGKNSQVGRCQEKDCHEGDPRKKESKKKIKPGIFKTGVKMGEKEQEGGRRN